MISCIFSLGLFGMFWTHKSTAPFKVSTRKCCGSISDLQGGFPLSTLCPKQRVQNPGCPFDFVDFGVVFCGWQQAITQAVKTEPFTVTCSLALETCFIYLYLTLYPCYSHLAVGNTCFGHPCWRHGSVRANTNHSEEHGLSGNLA